MAAGQGGAHGQHEGRVMRNVRTVKEFDAALAALGDSHPDARQYQELTQVVLDHPDARVLAELDPFSAAYREKALRLYVSLRTRVNDDLILPTGMRLRRAVEQSRQPSGPA